VRYAATTYLHIYIYMLHSVTCLQVSQMSNPPIDPNNQKAILLTRQAHEAELDGKYNEAYDLHAQASSLLVKVVADGKKKSDERRRARLQLKGAQDRRYLLQACMTGARPPPQPLPSLLTIQREITHPTPGTILLSLVGSEHLFNAASG
jgi:hypothetical protein